MNELPMNKLEYVAQMILTAEIGRGTHDRLEDISADRMKRMANAAAHLADELLIACAYMTRKS